MIFENMLCKKVVQRDFPGGPVVKILSFHPGVISSIPGWGTKVQHATWRSQKEEKTIMEYKLLRHFLSQCPTTLINSQLFLLLPVFPLYSSSFIYITVNQKVLHYENVPYLCCPVQQPHVAVKLLCDYSNQVTQMLLLLILRQQYFTTQPI